MQHDEQTGDNADNDDDARPEGPEKPEKSLKPRQVIASVFAAGLGVQSSKNRERDFSEGSAGTFIVAGLLFTALFIGGVYLLVQVVLKAAG
ncbi:MAG: DUF2970 domain-containing protein [Chromatocurvus sp.]